MCSAASAPGVPRALLLVWTDVPADMEAEFNDWYDREHMRERVEVPGFIRGRRFAAVSGAPRYLALYEAQSAAVMMSDAYLALNRHGARPHFVDGPIVFRTLYTLHV
ncbi:MAG: hypothetical protein HYY78_09745 [Betaproteobacteria bacterium]|nr:hypothetical protein [Betaproteobacteria bacterium]